MATTKPSSAADLIAAAVKMKGQGKAPPRGHEGTEIVDCPFLPNPATGEWGKPCVIKRLSPTEGLIHVGRVREGLRAMNPLDGDDRALREQFLAQYKVPQLDDPKEQEQWLHSCWLLVMGCVDPVLTFDEAAEWMTNTILNDVPVGDAADFLQFHIAALNKEPVELIAYRGGLATLRQLPAAFQGAERAFDGGEATLRAYLESDDETAKFVSRWGDVLAALALEKLRARAEIYAEANAKAITRELIAELIPMFFGTQDEGAADS